MKKNLQQQIMATPAPYCKLIIIRDKATPPPFTSCEECEKDSRILFLIESESLIVCPACYEKWISRTQKKPSPEDNKYFVEAYVGLQEHASRGMFEAYYLWEMSKSRIEQHAELFQEAIRYLSSNNIRNLHNCESFLYSVDILFERLRLLQKREMEIRGIKFTYEELQVLQNQLRHIRKNLQIKQTKRIK